MEATTIEQLNQYAKLATLTYTIPGKNLGKKPPNDERIDCSEEFFEAYIDRYIESSQEQNRLPTSIANQLLTSDGWTIPKGGYYDNVPRDKGGSGFAGTIYQNQVGETVFAIRGTEPGESSQDLIDADIFGIGFDGFASAQTIEMINFIERSKAGINDPYKVYKMESVLLQSHEIEGFLSNIDSNTQILRQFNSNPGSTEHNQGILTTFTLLSVEDEKISTSEALFKSKEKVTLTGHSLGGHLAVMAKRLYPDLFDDVYHYNAPGFNPPSSFITGLTKEFISAFKDFGNTPASSFDPEWGKGNIYAVESEDLALGNDTSIVASLITGATIYGEKYAIPVEYNSHLVAPIVDSLALLNLLDRMIPFSKEPYNLTDRLKYMTTLLESIDHGWNHVTLANDKVSGQDDRTLEKMIEKLYFIIMKKEPKTIDTAYANEGIDDLWSAAGSNVARESYSKIVLELEKEIPKDTTMRLTSLVDHISIAKIALINNAEDLLAFNQEHYSKEPSKWLTMGSVYAYRYALIEANPFALAGLNLRP